MSMGDQWDFDLVSLSARERGDKKTAPGGSLNQNNQGLSNHQSIPKPAIRKPAYDGNPETD
jgi:hypothetical protein